jgi:DNA-binding transcriptional LysR family regulator
MVGIHEIVVFLAAAKTENFSAAAQSLGLSQPAVTFQIRSLEEKLKVQLFERRGKRVVLTEMGRELLPIARELINAASSFEEAVALRLGTLKGRLQIGCGTGLAKYVLPQLIGAFHKRYPNVRISCEGMTRQIVEEKLASLEIHLGIVCTLSKTRELAYYPFFTDELVLIAASNHPWSARDEISLAELCAADWIVEKGHTIANLMRWGLAMGDIRVAIELNDDEAIQAAVEENQGVAFMSRIAAKRSVEAGAIKTIHIEGLTPIHREVFLVQPHSRTSILSYRFREFIESAEGRSLIAHNTSAAQEQ